MNSHFRTYYIYILTNKNKTVLYTGVTNSLTRRLSEHHENIILRKRTFAARYNCRHLLYYEQFSRIIDAIAREKEIKGWLRVKKLKLIKSMNPEMEFMEHLFL
ncbi:GIY-YIG nuclease family protein [Flagellimonas algicola]|uniref:GIY-YIG nuclease family protein n=1 Tax=Flagellimonas algicola TaxID=2583815 RepID=A0ABY2WK49_9FLAO|nr:GIY-YIG nuclease family protein [Allomuricauda algicola]